MTPGSVKTALKHCNKIKYEDINFFTVMKCKDATFAFIACALGEYNITFFSAFLSVHLTSVYNLTDSQVSLCFLLASGPYVLAAIMLPCIGTKVPRKVLFVVCFVVTSFSFGLMGPSPFFGMPNHLYLVLLGLGIVGFVQALVFIPALPEAIENF